MRGSPSHAGRTSRSASRTDAGERLDTVDLRGVTALIVNAREAERLAGRDDPVEAATALGEHVPSVVVTLGPRGAVGVQDGRLVPATAPEVEVADPTGGGDLFVAAYAWADLAG